MRYLFLCLMCLPSLCAAQIHTDTRFKTLVLSETFHSEGAAVADLNRDGHNDIVSGPFWYEGPDFRRKHAYTAERDYSIKAYSEQFFSFAYDFNSDGWTDVLCIPIPGGESVWHENPAGQGEWKRHVALKGVDNESPTFVDVTGDQKPELVCIHQGNFGYATWDTDNPAALWKFTALSSNKNLGRFTHGLGVGDIDGDGRADLLETNGWWQQPDDASQPFRFHATKFAQSGGSQMFAYDFDGDGDQDVVCSQNAHGYGLSWFERRGTEDDFLFVQHPIMTDKPADNPHGLSLSQMHALGLADVDGDGVMDIVTGKRYYAHGGGDPGAHQPPLLVWFRTVRSQNGVDFTPHVIHARSGVGTQITLVDVDKNGHVDVVVGNKLGTFVSLNSGQPGEALPIQSNPISLIGTNAFQVHVRETPPLEPDSEQQTFQLPDGFEAQLVASEPDIAKPMNLAFDAKGRLWVSSSLEYPYPAENGDARDTIKILDDFDDDGRAKKITTFADGLNIPIGLYPYGDGVICFSIPNIVYLRDTDGDGKADRREVLYGPMDTTRDTHGMCNAFTRGFDGWLYACHGFNNQTNLTSPNGAKVTMHSGNTFRIRVDGSDIQHFTWGQVNPFGLAFDPQGDLFSADCHTKPITLLLRGGYYDSFGKPHDGVGYVPNVMQHLHGSTGIAGLAFYHDDRYPSVFHGDAFGGNVMTGRINRNSIKRVGGTVQAREEPDFLVAGDPWFRPVDVQLGPDGALYVADFYNRIIGHYEVPLDHPGRDRHRGRIWRIVYTGAAGVSDRRDVPEGFDGMMSKRRFSADFDQLVHDLESPNLSRRLAATNSIVDRFPQRAGAAAGKLFRDSKTSPQAKVQAAWILSRIGELQSDDLASMIRADDDLLQTHALRIIGSQAKLDQPTQELLQQGLSNASGAVRRSAAIAATQHRSQRLIPRLLDAISQTPEGDVHTRHALKMALRDHLRNEAWFATTAKTLQAKHVPLVVELCLSIKTDFAGAFLVDHLDTVGGSKQIGEYLTFASRYASERSFARIAKLAQSRFADDLDFQEKLIRSVRQGIQQRGVPIPDPINRWATTLAATRLGIDPNDPQSLPPKEDVPIGWTESSHPDVGAAEKCWGISRRRRSADGQQNSLLHSSFVHGETRTGIYRSGAFRLRERFSFYLAGHDGVPGKPIQRKNLVRVRDEATDKILRQWSPPRNDTAQRMDWQPGKDQGRRVIVEIVDGDTHTAYAWLAAGRFSVPGLNPSDQVNHWISGIELIADFQLSQLRYVLVDLLRRKELDRATHATIARAILAQNPSTLSAALVESLTIRGVTGKLRQSVIDQVISPRGSETIEKVLAECMSVADESNQNRISQILASQSETADVLLRLIQSGTASPTVLQDEKINTTLAAVASQSQNERVAQIVRSIPSRDAAMQEKVDRRSKALAKELGDSALGAKLFAKHCSTCHQVAGQGKQVGPNLDGIGHRGLTRLIEDVLMPNRNIDRAFRATLILTEDGKVHTGLARTSDGDQTVLIDSQGKEIRLANDSISQRRETALSPMPANFAETFDDVQSRDLFAYLLSLTH